LFCPSVGGKAGKFLDEERPLKDYPLAGPVGFLEVWYFLFDLVIALYDFQLFNSVDTSVNKKPSCC